ncbi:MAG: NAD(+)/NADH kinase [Thermodesulfovibrionales bacterium]|nr:NAD(+)/NADH kinase [Thermodesulfovibrionales bacterium]
MKRIGLFCKTVKSPETLEFIRFVIGILKQYGCEVIVDIDTANLLNTYGEAKTSIPSVSDVIIVLGGDGTLLSAARAIGDKEIPIVGINLGSLGFLTEINKDGVREIIDMIIHNKARFEKRMMLNAVVHRDGKDIEAFSVLNDVVFNKGALARIIDMQTYVNNSYLTTFRGDGLIVSTPTGSTAYSLSAGGPILYPTLENILITPICPHTLTNRPIVLPPDVVVTVTLKSESQDVFLTLDGQVGFALKKDDSVNITSARFKTVLITPQNRDFFDILRTKLRWGER